MDNQTRLVQVAQAEDTFDLLQHIAWTDVVKPSLLKSRDQYAKSLVNHLLGSPLPDNFTKEQLAGRIYGIDYIINKFESILTQGKRALDEINYQGISLE